MMKFLMRTALLSMAVAGVSAVAKPFDDPRTPPPSPEPLKNLLSMINERLEIADLVALTKWDSAQPVQDSDRESTVIADAQRQAASYAIAKDEAAQIMAAQIEANKLVQYGLLSIWHSDGKAPLTTRPDLKNQIRPRLDALQTGLLQEYAKFSPFRADPNCPLWINQALPQLATDGLHEMALIRATGELCIQQLRATPAVLH
jgi:chorismate mutase